MHSCIGSATSMCIYIYIRKHKQSLYYMFKKIEHFSTQKEKLATIYKQYCNAKFIGNALPKFSTDEELSRTRMTTTSWTWLINLCRHVVCHGWLAKSSQVAQMTLLRGETSNIYCYSYYDAMRKMMILCGKRKGKNKKKIIFDSQHFSLLFRTLAKTLFFLLRNNRN